MAKSDSIPSIPTTRNNFSNTGPARKHSNFPTATSGNRGSQPGRFLGTSPYRTVPKTVNQGQGLDARRNRNRNVGGAPVNRNNKNIWGVPADNADKDKNVCPAPGALKGGGDAPDQSIDDKDAVPKKENLKETETDNHYSSTLKKEEKKEESKRELIFRIKENPALVREAEAACKNQMVQKEINGILDKVASGNLNLSIGNIRVQGLKTVSEARRVYGGRVYFLERYDNKIEILGKSSKDNQKTVIRILKEMG